MSKVEKIESVENTSVVPVPTPLPMQAFQEPKPPLFPDEVITGFFQEAINDINKDREEAGERYLQFADFIANPECGHPSSAMIETMAALLKIKNGTVDQKTKILELMVRLKLKQIYSPAEIHSFQQTNTKFEVNSQSPNVKNLIKLAEKMSKGTQVDEE